MSPGIDTNMLLQPHRPDIPFALLRVRSSIMKRRLSLRVSLLMIILGVLLGAFYSSQSTASGILSVYYFEARGNSGYDAVLLQAPNGMNIVIDSGAHASDNEFIAFLLNHGVGRIDYLIATNAGAGYVGLHGDLVWQYGDKIGKIVDVGQPNTSSHYQDYIQTACAQGIPITTPRDGDTLHWGSIRVTFFSPSEDQLARSLQDKICSPDYFSSALSSSTDSLVFKVEYANTSYFFAGDLGGDEMDALLQRHPSDLKSTVLDLPHSGELGPNQTAFLTAVSPSVAVAMASPFDNQGRPCDSLLQQLSQSKTPTYITGIHGTISMYSDGETNLIDTERDITSDPSALQSRKSTVQQC